MNEWMVELSRKDRKQYNTLPCKEKFIFHSLIISLKKQRMNRHEWPHFGKYYRNSNLKINNGYHCHEKNFLLKEY